MEYIEFDIHWDLQRLRNGFRSSAYFSVSGGINHMLDCPSDDFYFTSIFFPKETAASRALLAAEKEKTNAKVKYFEMLLQGSLAMYASNDAWPLSILRENQAINVNPCAFNLESIDRREFSATEPFVQHAILALGVKEYASLLLFFQRGSTWGEWYKVMENITNEYPQRKKKNSSVSTPENLIFDSKELERFRYTANNPIVSGLNARHGGEGRGMSSRVQPMTESEGHEFIKKMTLAYAYDKAKKYLGWR